MKRDHDVNMNEITEDCDHRIEMFRALDASKVPMGVHWYLGGCVPNYVLPDDVLCEHGYHDVRTVYADHTRTTFIACACHRCGVRCEPDTIRIGR